MGFLKKKKEIKKNDKVWINFFLILSFLAFFVVSYYLFRETYKKYQIKKEVEDLKKEAQTLEQGNQKLKGTIDYFRTLGFREKEAREKLNVKKDGERLVILKNSGEKEDRDLVKPREEEKILERKENEALKLPNPIQWWDYFFKS